MTVGSSVLTVTQLNNYIKSILEDDVRLRTVYLSAEISGFKVHYASGHWYFSLKDSDSIIKAAMFRGCNSHMKFIPEDGMKVIVRGKIGLYLKSGEYSLYVEDMEPEGVGALAVAFEKLKEKLQAEGLFDEEKKKTIPRYPRVVGVVTSATGAAVRDVINVISRRFPPAAIKVYPVLVQGDGAAGDIASAIAKANEEKICDVLIVGRGGGSIEDLWAFNEEVLARAVYASRIPVISAVGHETDYTICDFVADLRAPTPSAAAELAVPDEREERTKLSKLSGLLYSAVSSRIRDERITSDGYVNRLLASGPAMRVKNMRSALDSLTGRSYIAVSAYLSNEKQRFTSAVSGLEGLSPLKVLARGYAVVTDESGKAVRRAGDTSAGEGISVRFSDGALKCRVEETVKGN